MNTLKDINTITENITNLSSVWRTVGRANNSYRQADGFEYCASEGISWPNRLWFTKPVTNKVWNECEAVVSNKHNDLLIPYFDTSDTETIARMNTAGWELVFEQVGMSLPLTTLFTVGIAMKLERVKTYEEAVLWCDLFEKSFNYRIQPEAVFNSVDVVEFWLAYVADQAIGTVLTHSTGNTFGIHAVGIPPINRRKGYAENIMRLALNNAVELGNTLAVLQASALGLGIYLRLGFEEEFRMGTFKN